LDFTEAGTVAAMAALVDWAGMVAVGRATELVVVAGAVVLELLELLLQAAATRATVPMVATTRAVRILRVELTTIPPPLSIR
jgi:hypothetical protein